MPAEFDRGLRIAALLQREVSTVLSREMRDKRLSMLTVTRVDMSRDRKKADIGVTSMEDKLERSAILSSLSRVSGWIRVKIGGNLHLKVIPELVFYYDESVERGMALSQLIDDLQQDQDIEKDTHE